MNITQEERDKILQVLKDHLQVNVEVSNTSRNGLRVQVDLRLSVNGKVETIDWASDADTIDIQTDW